MTDAPETCAPQPSESGPTGGLVGRLRLPHLLRGTGRLRFSAVDLVLAKWDRLRGDRIAPARAELDPARLAPALEFMFVAEIVAPGVARLRLAGQSLYNTLGMEPRGMPLCCLMAPPAREELAEAVRQVAHGARVRLPLRAPRGLGRPAMDGQMVLLPLTDSAGRITRLLGVLETHGQPGRTPRRFHLAGAASPLFPPAAAAPADPMTTGRIPPNPEPSAPLRTEPHAQAPETTTTAVGAVPGRAGWRVIEGGRA